MFDSSSAGLAANRLAEASMHELQDQFLQRLTRSSAGLREECVHFGDLPWRQVDRLRAAPEGREDDGPDEGEAAAEGRTFHTEALQAAGRALPASHPRKRLGLAGDGSAPWAPDSAPGLKLEP